MQKKSLIHCWWECKMIQPLWKNMLAVSLKTKHATTIQLSDCISRNLFQRNENLQMQIPTHKCLEQLHLY